MEYQKSEKDSKNLNDITVLFRQVGHVTISCHKKNNHNSLSAITRQQTNISDRKQYQTTQKFWPVAIINDRAAHSIFQELRNWSTWLIVHQLWSFLSCRSYCPIVMTRGTKISTEIQWVILWLSKFLKIDQIAMCVEVLERSIRRVISHFRTHGIIEGGTPVQEEHKWNRHLRDVDVEVSILTLFIQNLELTPLAPSSYLGLSINNRICTLTSSRKCLKLVVVPVFHNLPSGEHSDGLDSQWKKWANHLCVSCSKLTCNAP